MATTDMTVKIQPNDKGNPAGKLADAELHFTAGPLEGLKLIGFGIWETRGGARRNVTFPARQYAVNGERRSFALLAAHRRHRRAGAHSRSRARGVRGIRGAGLHHLVEPAAGASIAGAPVFLAAAARYHLERTVTHGSASTTR